MRDILIDVIEKCLVLLIPAAIAYSIACTIYFIIKKEKPLFKKTLFVFILIYYFICIIRLTLFFEPSSQNTQNFIPLNFVLYGYEELLEQFIYNILLFIPLGILLPVVFPRKFYKLAGVFLVALIISLTIEAFQYIVGRNVDVNDVIANSMGGITGYALCFIIISIYLMQKKNQKNNKFKFVIYILTAIIVPLSVPIAYSVYESTLPYGYTTIYTLRLDENADINVLLSNEESQRMVYKEIPVNSEDKLKEIMSNLGIDGEIYTSADGAPLGASAVLEDGSLINIGINAKNACTWYLSIDNISSNKGIELLSDQLLDISLQGLSQNGIEVDKGMIASSDYYDNVFRIVYTVSQNIGDEFIYGNVTELNNYGEIVYVEDNRIRYSEIEPSAVISSEEAIKRAQMLPYDIERKDMRVESIVLEYMRYNNNAYLLPVWRLSGTYMNDENATEDWVSYVSALK